MTEPLSPEQRLAASRVAAGEELKSIAKDLDVGPRTLSRWKGRPDFRELVHKQREALVGELGSPEEVARAALVATKPNGSPDWSARLQAVKILLSAPAASDEAQAAARRTERIYIRPDDDGAPRPTPADPDEIHHRGEEAEQARIQEEIESAWAAREASPA